MATAKFDSSVEPTESSAQSATASSYCPHANNAFRYHGTAFVEVKEVDGKPKTTFCPYSVEKGLIKYNATHPTVTGRVIATFNASHAENWPMTSESTYEPDAQGEWKKMMHLGTTRIWRADTGGIDADRMRQFVDYMSKGLESEKVKLIPLSKLYKYLDECTEKDPVELNTGRNAIGFFASKSLQCTAAKKGWEKAYELLSDHPNETDPTITLEQAIAFFENTEKAFDDAAAKRKAAISSPM